MVEDEKIISPNCLILFLEAMTGSYTIFKKGKINAFKFFEKNKKVINNAEVLTKTDSSPNVVFDNNVFSWICKKYLSKKSLHIIKFLILMQLKKPFELPFLHRTSSADR